MDKTLNNIRHKIIKITKAQYNVALTEYFILFPKKPKNPI